MKAASQFFKHAGRQGRCNTFPPLMLQGSELCNMETNTGLINNLIETLKDGEAGFHAAAEDVTNPELKSIFERYSAQRKTFSSELQSLVVREGEKPETTGSIAAVAHRGWMSVKSTVSSREDSAILEECERGEDSAVSTFEDAVKAGDLGVASEKVNRQSIEIRKAHDHMRSLRDQYKRSVT